MKLSTLLLSSAALVVAGSAYAADLPAKKGAPAAKPATGCPAFGTGFFQIPGTDNCIKFSGRVTADTSYVNANNSRTTATQTFSSGFRLQTDVRSNTDAGTLRTYYRLSGSSAGTASSTYGYIQLGGLTAGYADTAFAGYNGAWNWNADGFDDGAVTNQISYTAALGGSSSLTVSMEDPTKRATSSKPTYTYNDNTTGVTSTETIQGAAQYPDLVGNLKFDAGSASFKLSGAVHNNHGYTSGDVTGFAVQGYGKFTAAPGTELHAQLTYANAANSYLGYTGSSSTMADYTTATVSNTAKGYAALGAVSQAVGAGSAQLSGRYAVITSSASPSVDTKVSQLELSYDYTGIKGMQIVPMVYVKGVDNGTTVTNSTTGFLRIERDF